MAPAANDPLLNVVHPKAKTAVAVKSVDKRNMNMYPGIEEKIKILLQVYKRRFTVTRDNLELFESSFSIKTDCIGIQGSRL